MARLCTLCMSCMPLSATPTTDEERLSEHHAKVLATDMLVELLFHSTPEVRFTPGPLPVGC